MSGYGDSALLVSRRHPDPARRWALMQAVAASLRAQRVPGVEAVVATFEDLLVEYDPLVCDGDELRRRIALSAPAEEPPLASGRTVRLPMVYGGDNGPDLDDVAAELGITADQLIDRHSSTDWTVAFTGAPAGAPLHTGEPLGATPIRRRSSPRVRIPAGTVALSGTQGTIYTVEAPGGWRLIGRTPVRIIRQGSDDFVSIRPGDTLRFSPLSEAEFAAFTPVDVAELIS